MSEPRDIEVFFNKILSNIIPEDDARIIEQERKLQEEKLLIHYRQTVPERFYRESLYTYKIDDSEKRNALGKARIFMGAVKKRVQRRHGVSVAAIGYYKTDITLGSSFLSHSCGIYCAAFPACKTKSLG